MLRRDGCARGACALRLCDSRPDLPFSCARREIPSPWGGAGVVDGWHGGDVACACAGAGDPHAAVAAFEQAMSINPRLAHLRQHVVQLLAQIDMLEEQRQLEQQQQQPGDYGEA